MKNTFVNSGSIVAGLLASACCIGPLLALLLSVSGLAVAAALEPYRPYLMGVTAIFLATGFYFAYRPQPAECKPGEECAPPQSRKPQRIALWIVTIVAVVLMSFPYLPPYLV